MDDDMNPDQQHLEFPDFDITLAAPGRRSRRRVIAGVTAAITGLSFAGWGINDALASGSSVHGFPSVAGLAADSSINADSVSSAIEKSVVDIDATDRYTGEEDAGTGMIITSSGDILTNNHVVADSTSLTVRLVSTGKTYRATVVGTDATKDIAVIRITGVSGLPTITAADASSVKVGTAVAAVGNALGKAGTPTVTTGAITGTDRSITASDEDGSAGEHLTGLLETDADVVSGDSGGPLVDSSGQVIGMDTAASASDTGGFGSGDGTITSSNDGYAIPITSALAVARQIVSGKASSTIVIGTPGFLGLEIASSGSSDSAGDGDQGGQGYGGFGGGQGYGGFGGGQGYGGFGGGQGYGGFGGGSDGAPSYGGGTVGTAYATGTSTTGTTVAGVISGSPAAAAGITAGDTITAINGASTTTAQALTAILDKTHGGQQVTVAWTDTAGAAHHATVTLIAGPAA